MSGPASTLLTAAAAPPFFAELAALLVASALVAYLCHRIGVTPIVSFLVTGALIGPQALGLVHDEGLIEAAAEVGVVLLLFTIGIEFSLAKLVRIPRRVFVAGGLQVGLALGAVAGLSALFGVGWRAGLFTGCLVALSSTAIVMKLLSARGETDTPGGRTVLGILIVQDLAVVGMALLVPMLGGRDGSATGIAWALAKAVALVAVVLVVARRVMPRVLEAVARTCSQEIFVLAVMAICFGTAWLTSLAGLSLSLGAFLAGLVVSESRFSELAFGDIQPLQILFSATFFVSVGLLLDLRFLWANLPLVAAAVAAVLAIKTLTAGLGLRLLGYATGPALFSSLMIAQVGEFSFVIERTGREMGLYPWGMEQGGPQAFIAATVVLMMATPWLARLGAALARRFPGRAAEGPGEEATAALPAGHVIVAGYGEVARKLVRALAERGVPYLILTLSPGGAREAEEEGRPVLAGNYARRHELSRAGVDRARLLVVADDEPAMTRRVVRAVAGLNPALPVVTGLRSEAGREAWREAGPEPESVADPEGVARLVERVLEEVARPAGPGGAVALSRRQRESPRCLHAAATRETTPRTAGCEECLELGETWVHLRLCMTCGHVGCCDSSKNRHATKHFHATGHPVVRSLQPGEDWAWCYVDEVTF